MAATNPIPTAEPGGNAAQPQESPEPQESPQLRCDFCGRSAARVRRVVLDEGYERLQTPHPVRYACPDCSEAKERARKGGAAPRD